MTRKNTKTEGKAAPTTGAAPTNRFQAATKTTKHRLIVSIEGREKCGKTFWSLTAPGPIGLINTDIGLEGVVDKFVEDKVIYVAEYQLDFTLGRKEEIQEQAERLWVDFTADYYAALQSCRTVVLDTASEVWALLRFARFGKLSKVMPTHYEAANAEFRELIRGAYEHNTNLILVHKQKPVWVTDGEGKSSKSGEFERAGFGDVGFLTQLNLLTKRVNQDGGGAQFELTVLDCRQNADIIGLTLPSPTFAEIATLVYPETDESDWS